MLASSKSRLPKSAHFDPRYPKHPRCPFCMLSLCLSVLCCGAYPCSNVIGTLGKLYESFCWVLHSSRTSKGRCPRGQPFLPQSCTRRQGLSNGAYWGYSSLLSKLCSSMWWLLSDVNTNFFSQLPFFACPFSSTCTWMAESFTKSKITAKSSKISKTEHINQRSQSRNYWHTPKSQLQKLKYVGRNYQIWKSQPWRPI